MEFKQKDGVQRKMKSKKKHKVQKKCEFKKIKIRESVLREKDDLEKMDQ